VLRRLEARLDSGEPARRETLDEDESRLVRGLNLLTRKPEMIVVNVDEADAAGESPAVEQIRDHVRGIDAEVVAVCAGLEAELASLDPEERTEFAEVLDVEQDGLERLIRAGYRLLGLHTFFTMNDKEARAWTLTVGAKAPDAAGRVHSDFQEHFIRAETIGWKDLVEHGSLRAAREAGKVRAEGRDYVVKDGELLLFRTSA